MKINVTRTEKLTAAINDAQARASVRTIVAADVEWAIGGIEQRLKGLMYKKDWAGLVFDCDMNAQEFPGAYKGTPESTHFTLERGATGWFVTAIYRGECRRPTQRITCRNIAAYAEKIAEFVASRW
jgi:hypothetical protein